MQRCLAGSEGRVTAHQVNAQHAHAHGSRIYVGAFLKEKFYDILSTFEAGAVERRVGSR